MEILQLRYFKAVADKGKIVTAAESLFISPPALSSTISRLEKELDVKLFDRTSNSITLNKQGEIFLRYVNQILTNLEYAKLELHTSSRDKEPHIRIAVTNSNLWIELFCAFSLEHPEITLSNTSMKLSQVSGGTIPPKYSFILAEEGDFPGENLNSLVLFDDDQPVLMVHPSHPLAKLESVDLQTVTDEVFLLPVADMSMHKMIASLLADVPTSNIYEYSYMMRRRMVRENRGVSFSTMYASKAEDPQLCYVPINAPYCRQKQKIFWDKFRPLSKEEITFRNFAVDYFNLEPPV